MNNNLIQIAVIGLYLFLSFLSLRMLYRKGYLSYAVSKVSSAFSNFGCIFWILFGWWGLLIVVVVGLTVLSWILPFIWLFGGLISDRN